MKKIIFLIAIIICSIQFVIAESKIPVNLVKIVDGDTVIVKINNNNFQVRLIGIDCYETSKIHRAYRQAYENNLSIDEVVQKGLYSKDYFEHLFKISNKNVFLDFKGIDKYSRALGIIYFDDLNVNEVLKNDGGCLIYEYE